MADPPQVVILAAGRGTRMRSSKPKVLHELGGRPLIECSLELATSLGAKPVVVISPLQSLVRDAIAERATVVEQKEQLGTGDALRSIPPELRSDGPVVVTYADVPLLKTSTFIKMMDLQTSLQSDCVLLAARPLDPAGLGRLERGHDDRVVRIVEEKDLSENTQIGEINAGAYIFNGAALWPLVDGLSANNAQHEYYLTDVVELIGGADTVTCEDLDEIIGINDRSQLAQAELALRQRVLKSLMAAGVTIEDPATTYVDAAAEIGADTVIRPLTVIRGRTILGENCEIGPMAQLSNVTAGYRVRIGSSVLEDCELGDEVTIGHFDRVRPDTKLASGVLLGTHAEVKNSSIGSGTRINHFACVLDSDVGSDVNIGAGTVTCNYDGESKARTTIGDRVFVGTNSTLVAPLTLAADSYIAAGSTITADVPSDALGVGRERQRNVEGWVSRKNGKVKT